MIYYDVRNLYEEHYDKSALITFLNNNDLTYFGILHNKDTFPNGEFKKPHYHLICGVDKDSKIAKQFLISLFNDDNLLFQNIRSLPHYVRYLTHKDNLEKYQYNDNEVFCSNVALYEELVIKQITTSKTDSLLDDFYKYLLSLNWYLIKSESDFDVIAFGWFRDKMKLDYLIRNRHNIILLFYRELKPLFMINTRNEKGDLNI